MGQTDGQTLYRYIDSAMYYASNVNNRLDWIHTVTEGCYYMIRLASELFSFSLKTRAVVM